MTERGAVPGFAIDVPSMNIVIQVVGSQGDVEPFVALGLVLKQKHGHRVRIATHPQFKASVEEYGLEFFSLGAESSNLVSLMVESRKKDCTMWMLIRPSRWRFRGRT